MLPELLAVAKTWVLFVFILITLTYSLPRSLPHYLCCYGHIFHFRRRSRTTIHFRSASANFSIFEIRTVVRNVFQVSRRFRVHWFSDPFHERLRGAPALRVFTSARSSYIKPKIKRIHRGFGRCSFGTWCFRFQILCKCQSMCVLILDLSLVLDVSHLLIQHG